MIFGYARVSTDGQTLEAQLAALKATGAERVFQEKVSGAKADRPQLAKLLNSLNAGDTVLVTRLDRLARSTRDLLNALDHMGKVGAGFRSLADAWADTTTPHSRLMLTVLGGLAEFERELISAPAPGKGEHAPKRAACPWAAPCPRPSPAPGSSRQARPGRRRARRGAQLRSQSFDNIAAQTMSAVYLTRHGVHPRVNQLRSFTPLGVQQ